MKTAIYFSLFLFALLTFVEKSFSITDYQIKKICKRQKKELICIKTLKEKRSNLQKGKLIEIPVEPYKK